MTRWLLRHIPPGSSIRIAKESNYYHRFENYIFQIKGTFPMGERVYVTHRHGDEISRNPRVHLCCTNEQIYGLVQERRNSSASAMELRLCTNPSRWWNDNCNKSRDDCYSSCYSGWYDLHATDARVVILILFLIISSKQTICWRSHSVLIGMKYACGAVPEVNACVSTEMKNLKD